MKTRYAIIGGGVAGLCAAIRLAELGEASIVIEAGGYPAHKICGEFLSPECIEYLNNWNIHPIPILSVVINTSTTSLTFPFPYPAGGLSHLQLDPALAEYALKVGATLKTNTKVLSFGPKGDPGEFHRMELSNGESLEAGNVIIATGRIPGYSTKVPTMSYMGFKTHFKNISSEGNLEMFSFPGAYLGIAPIEDHKFNVACLASLKLVDSYSDPRSFIENLISLNPLLKTTLSQGENLLDEWMISPLPSFGIKQTPDWLDAYFIGDSAVTIPPACGDGLSMAILGGRLAAEYALRQQPKDFKKMWIKRCSSQIFFGKILHQLMLNPSCGTFLFNLANRFPCLARKVFNVTRNN